MKKISMFLFLVLIVAALGCADVVSKGKDKSTMMDILFGMLVKTGIAQEVPAITDKRIWNDTAKTWDTIDCSSGTYSLGAKVGIFFRMRLYSNYPLHPIGDGIFSATETIMGLPSLTGVDSIGNYLEVWCNSDSFNAVVPFRLYFSVYTLDKFYKISDGSCGILK